MTYEVHYLCPSCYGEGGGFVERAGNYSSIEKCKTCQGAKWINPDGSPYWRETA